LFWFGRKGCDDAAFFFSTSTIRFSPDEMPKIPVMKILGRIVLKETAPVVTADLSPYQPNQIMVRIASIKSNMLVTFVMLEIAVNVIEIE
jgi:hypothetical protein